MSSTAIAPAAISPRRPVPASIARREDAERPTPAPFTADRIRAACRRAAQARALVGAHVAPGITTDELDRVGHEFLCDHGAYPSTLGYKGFPKSLCASVNEVIF